MTYQDPKQWVKQGMRVRVTCHYPERSAFCKAEVITYEGTVEKIYSVPNGDLHARLVDLSIRTEPTTPLKTSANALRAQAPIVLLLKHQGHVIWEKLDPHA